MKYYSEILKKAFDTETECLTEEAAYNKEMEEKKAAEEKKKNERKQRAAEVDAARIHMTEVQEECSKKIDEAQKKYIDLRNQFVKDYGYYHYSTSGETDSPSLLDMLLNFQRIL